jgi:tetratricopeptide (TPR) repeat protein
MFTALILSSILLSSTSATPISTPLTPSTQQQQQQTDILGFPEKKILANDYYVAQTFNNCGPATLSMALSYYNIFVSQETLGKALRPYQNAYGDNDDKSVTLDELAEKTKEYDLIPFHRPNGSVAMINQFISYGMPVIVRTWMTEDDAIGHYRVVKGFDNITQQSIQDDPIQDKNLRYSYQTFTSLWEKYNYEYLVLVPKEKLSIAQTILGENLDAKKAWKLAEQKAQKQLDKNPEDIYAQFNLAVAHENRGEYQKTIEEYEPIANKLPWRTLWYQIEPIEAYYYLGEYDKVLTITDHILNNHNRAFSELYLLRGEIYKRQGNLASAKEEFEKALYYNSSLKKAQEALRDI